MSLLVRVLAAVALAVVAFVHLDIAPLYDGVGSPSLATQFRAQSVVAVLLAVAVLARPRALVWVATAAFAALSLGVLVWSRYRCLYVPDLGGCFTETWDAPGARTSAVAESAALALAAAGLALRRRP